MAARSQDAVRIHTLGRVAVRGAGGERLSGLERCPKRLALLVYLAVARPHGLHSRDALQSMFWPEHDAPHSQGALRQTLHLLRQDVRGGVVESGRGGVRLDATLVRVDALELEAALGRDDARRAVGWYRGEFLNGFHAGAVSPEFEHWREAKSAGLRLGVLRALDQLAGEAEAAGRPREAEDWLRRRATLSPHDEETVRDLIRVLVARGNRALAVDAYEGFVRKLREELDLEPSDATRALGRSLRAGAPAGGA